MDAKQTKVLAILVAIILIGLVGWAIYMQIKEHHAQDDPMLHELMETIRPVFHEDNYHSGELHSLNNRNVLDEITLYRGDKSYTINKEKVFLCLRDENGEYYNKNMLIYVILHEIAHVICDEIGHTDKFHRIFEQLLLKATEKEIYNPSIPIIQDYCQHND